MLGPTATSGQDNFVYVRVWNRTAIAATNVRARVFYAPAATLLAFAAWLSGDGALAWCALDRARTADPDYSMAALVERALTCAVPPSSWEPLTEESLSLFAG